LKKLNELKSSPFQGEVSPAMAKDGGVGKPPLAPDAPDAPVAGVAPLAGVVPLNPLLEKKGIAGKSTKWFNFRRINMSVFVLAVLVTAGCQDHHFVPMEKAGHIKMTGAGGARDEKTFEKTGPAQKEVMTGAYTENVKKVPVFKDSGGKNLSEVITAKNKKPPASGIIAAGQISLGAAQGKRDFSGYTVYVIARITGGAGAPVAVLRLAGGKFPIDFRLDESNLMTGSLPSPDEQLYIEARLDRDGDVCIERARRRLRLYGRSGRHRLGKRFSRYRQRPLAPCRR